MTTAEQVTGFKLEGATVVQFLAALTKYCKKVGVEPDEYGFTPSMEQERAQMPNPRDMRWFIAFVNEGANEGFYVHVGCIQCGERGAPSTYHDLGFAKTFSTENAYALTREAQRFLTATLWN